MRKGNYLLIISFLSIIFTIPILGVIKPDEKVSMVENRELQSFPQLNNKIEDFTHELDNYFTDQFPYRDILVKIYTRLELIAKRTDIRDAILIEDWLFGKDYPIDKNSLQGLINSLGKAVDINKDIEFYYIVFPSKLAMLSDLYPKYLDGSISESNNKILSEGLESIGELNIINILDIMLTESSPEEREKYYYKTDFHWNSEGAFRAFEVMINHIKGEKILKEAKNKIKNIDFKDKYFKGDLEKRFSGNIKNQDIPVINEIVDTEGLMYFTSIDDTSPVDRHKLISPNINKRSVDYNDIYTSNLSCIRIINKNAVTNTSALFFKDSYFNAMVEPMSAVFSELIIIDPRYYKEDYNYGEILEEKDLDYVFFCYHQSNVDESLIFFLQQ